MCLFNRLILPSQFHYTLHTHTLIEIKQKQFLGHFLNIVLNFLSYLHSHTQSLQLNVYTYTHTYTHKVERENPI